MSEGRAPLVSVIIPAYNHARYIEACLDSVAAETYADLELLVLDDGSKDDTFARVQAWAARHEGRFRRVKAWTQPNAGICRTLNRLVAAAEGALVTIVASDDALLPGGIAARVDALVASPRWLAVFGDAEVIDTDGKTTAGSALRDDFQANTDALKDPARITLALVVDWCVPGPVFMARREAWDPARGVGPYREDMVVEDRDFYLRLLARGALGFVDRPVARYRVHGGNACRQTLREEVLRDIHRSNARNLPLFRGRAWLCLWAIVRQQAARDAGRRLETLLARKIVRYFRRRVRGA